MNNIDISNITPCVVNDAQGNQSQLTNQPQLTNQSQLTNQALRVNTKPAKFDAIKRYRTYHNISGFFKGLKDFAHNAYKQRLFRTLPGTTYIVFDNVQSWFPTDRTQQTKLGSDLYLNVSNRNNLFNALGVRFYFSHNSSGKQMIEMQVVNSDPKDIPNKSTSNKCTAVRGKTSVSDDSKWDALVATPKAPRHRVKKSKPTPTYKSKAPDNLDLSSIKKRLDFDSV
jgi:hypothetical protein